VLTAEETRFTFIYAPEPSAPRAKVHLMACTDPALSPQEQRFLQILARVDRAAAVGDRLTLYAKDRPVARLVAVYFQ
jgi:hypothetical protein